MSTKWLALAEVCALPVNLVTGRIAAKQQPDGIKFTHRPKIRFFAPQGRLVAPIQVKLGRADGYLGRLAVQNFTSIVTGGWECGPQNIKNFHFLEEKPEWCPCQNVKKVRWYVYSFRHSTVGYWTDGRTDGRKWQNNISLCMHSKFTRDKKTDQLNKLITVKRTKSSLMGGVIGRGEWAWLGDRWAGLWASLISTHSASQDGACARPIAVRDASVSAAVSCQSSCARCTRPLQTNRPPSTNSVSHCLSCTDNRPNYLHELVS